jgi:enoyl-CoA hydratase/carnithine racemase
MSATNLYKEINIPAVLNSASIAALTQQLTEAEHENARFIVLKGSAGIFCNGLDLGWVANSETGDHLVDMQHYAAFLKKLQGGKCISIALVNGMVSGGGMGVVCACDHVIVSETSTFSLPEGLLGLIPGMILPSLLNRLTPQRIKKMVLTGKKYSAEAALAWDIADEIVSEPEQQNALTIAINSMRSCKPGAVSDMKEILYASHISKNELAQMGMTTLITRLNDPEIKQRLKDISDFM